MKKRFFLLIAILFLIYSLTSCGSGVREGSLSGVIHITVDSDPVAGEVYWRIGSSVPEVRSTNRFYLGLTPYHETRQLNIPGLTQENAVNVVVVIELKKKGYYEVVERLNLSSILDERKISLKYQLEKSDGTDRVIPSQNPYSFVRPPTVDTSKPVTPSPTPPPVV